MLALIWTFLFFGQQAFAAWSDSSEGRIYAVKLFRRDFNTPGNILMGEERTNFYEKYVSEVLSGLSLQKWTDDRGTQ